jgi:hypothetical protein
MPPRGSAKKGSNPAETRTSSGRYSSAMGLRMRSYTERYSPSPKPMGKGAFTVNPSPPLLPTWSKLPEPG